MNDRNASSRRAVASWSWRSAAGNSCNKTGNAIDAPNRVLGCLRDVEIVICVNGHARRPTHNRRCRWPAIAILAGADGTVACQTIRARIWAVASDSGDGSGWINFTDAIVPGIGEVKSAVAAVSGHERKIHRRTRRGSAIARETFIARAGNVYHHAGWRI